MTEQERIDYCKDCKRSIYGDQSCDCNIEDKGYYNGADDECKCKVPIKEK